MRLQQRDGELDLPGAVVLLHGWGGGRWAGGGDGGRAGGGLGAGAGALLLRSAPARPQPGALGSRLPAQRSRLPAPGTLRPPIGSAPAPPGPLPLPPPGALTPSWLRRRLPGVTAPWAGERGVAGSPSRCTQRGRVSGGPQSSGWGAEVGRDHEELLQAGAELRGWEGGGALREMRQQTREDDFL